MNTTIAVTWFLWSILYPGAGQFTQENIRAMPVKGFESQEECEKTRIAYRIEVDKAYPEPEISPETTSILVTWTTFELKCSPINPRP